MDTKSTTFVRLEEAEDAADGLAQRQPFDRAGVEASLREFFVGGSAAT